MLSGKSILITGGGSGIGEALASILSVDNRVIVCGRNESNLRRVAESNSNISYYVANLSVPSEIDRLFKRIAHDQVTLDVLFNNAGVVEQFEVMRSPYTSQEIFDRVSINLSAGIAIAQQFINQSNRQRENLIVNITSEIALFPIPLLALYSSSKAGFRVFTRALRQQLKNTGFRVIEILPPQVDTGMPKQIGNESVGIDAREFARSMIRSIAKGDREYAPGKNVPLLTFLSKFLPEAGLRLIDTMSRKQLRVP